MFHFIMALLAVFGIPALIAYFLALVFPIGRLGKRWSNPRRMRIVMAIAIYVLLLVSEFLLFYWASFDR